MAFKQVQTLDADKTITIGGADRKSGKKNPTGIEGYYLGSRSVPGNKFGESTLYFFQTADGNVGVWGKTDLKKKMGGVPSGTMTRVTYTGLKPTKNGDMHTYRVEIDSDNTIDVSDISTAASENIQDAEEYYDNDEDSDGDELPSYDVDQEQDEEPSRPAISANQQERAAKVQALLSKKGGKRVG